MTKLSLFLAAGEMAARAHIPSAPSQEFEAKWPLVKSTFDQVVCLVESSSATPLNTNEWRKQAIEAYTICYNLSTKTKGMKEGRQNQQTLYVRCREMVERHLLDDVLPQFKGKHDESLLEAANKAWNTHLVVAKWCKFMFSYLDAFFTGREHEPVREMIMKLFRDKAFLNISDDIRKVILNQTLRSREGFHVDMLLLSNSVRLFVGVGGGSLDVYDNNFLDSFMSSTAEFYHRLASTWMSEAAGPISWLRRAEERIEDEQRRASTMLHPSSVERTMKIVYTELLAVHQDALLKDPEAGVAVLLEKGNFTELNRMCRLFAKVPKGLEPMGIILRDYIRSQGQSINNEFCSGRINGNEYVDNCIKLHDHFVKLISTHMCNDVIFHREKQSAFELFFKEPLTFPRTPAQIAAAHPASAETTSSSDSQKMISSDGSVPSSTVQRHPSAISLVSSDGNARGGALRGGTRITTSELLALYIDALLRVEKMSDAEREMKMDAVVQLFTFASEKDAFAEYYRKLLAKRLLASRSGTAGAGEDAEKVFILKIKMKMGSVYTSKLEGMVTDKTLSGEADKKFKGWLGERSVKLPIDFSVQVLTTGSWPGFNKNKIALPSSMQFCIDTFARYYETITRSRVLTFIHSYGQTEVQAQYPKGTKLIGVNAYQAALLLLFNASSSTAAPSSSSSSPLLSGNSAVILDTDSGASIISGIQVKSLLAALAFEHDEDTEMRQALMPLLSPKFPLLLKTGEPKQASHEDVVSVNLDFQNKQLFKFRVPQFVKTDGSGQPGAAVQDGETQERINENRKYVIEAAIVRIMKARKQLRFPELVNETVKILSNLFQPDVKVVKRRIEDLMTRAFLARDENDTTLIHYLA